MKQKPLLRMEHISKSFQGTQVLYDVHLRVAYGQCCGLVGENGSGKSTLMKILTGVYRKEADGVIEFDGALLEPGKFVDISKAGISMVHQEATVFPYLSVAENLFLGRWPKRRGLVDWPKMFDEAERLLRDVGLSEIDVKKPLSEYGAGIQQLVAIMRAVSLRCKLLILDEPTSSLDAQEIQTLFHVLRRLIERGVSMIYISHKLEELYEICQHVYVIRDGRNIADYDLPDLLKERLITDMIGKSSGNLLRRHSLAAPGRKTLLRGEHLADGGRLKAGSVSVSQGEIVGLAGLLGSGRTELAHVVFGLSPLRGGTLWLDEEPVRMRSPRQALRRGLSLLTEDRKSSGIIPEMSVRENIVLSAGKKISRFGVINRRKERALAQEAAVHYDIRCRGLEDPIRVLSGGNQQKALLARMMMTEPRLVLLDSPTRGIDLPSKDAIERLIQNLQRQGIGFLLISSELPELIRNCHRVVVLTEGRTTAELTGEEISEEGILTALAGGYRKQTACGGDGNA